MANKPGIASDIQCPFFITLRDRRIVCEAPVPSAESIGLFFSSASRRYAHVLWHCNEMDGAGCPVYEAIMRSKYKDG